jgi:poly(3-hydroxybutyrate) depolymerase
LRRVPPAYDGTQPGPVVVLYRIEGGGHTWPDSKFSRAIEAAVGPTTISINADVMWSFFQAHPRRA